jgi:hypothetical protein
MKEEIVAIYNHVFHGTVSTRGQKLGAIVCIPKKETPTLVSDYRPITLLNTDYKILARLLANRLKPKLDVLLHTGQTSSTAVRTIMDATAGIRDVIAFGETRKSGIGLYLSLRYTSNQPVTKYHTNTYSDSWNATDTETTE